MNQPTWFYKEVVVPELVDIQREVMLILPELISSEEAISFYYIKRETIESKLPSYTNFISRMGLIDRWKYSAIVSTENGKEFPIHVDSLDWEHRCYGLNLPILNCEHSDTVWYDAEIIDSLVTDNYDNRNAARLCKSAGAKELCRMPATTTAWVNVSIPHRPESKNTNLRVTISARFSPEVHDYI
jgi:hypothetical protein